MGTLLIFHLLGLYPGELVVSVMYLAILVRESQSTAIQYLQRHNF